MKSWLLGLVMCLPLPAAAGFCPDDALNGVHLPGSGDPRLSLAEGGELVLADGTELELTGRGADRALRIKGGSVDYRVGEAPVLLRIDRVALEPGAGSRVTLLFEGRYAVARVGPARVHRGGEGESLGAGYLLVAPNGSWRYTAEAGVLGAFIDTELRSIDGFLVNRLHSSLCALASRK